VKLPNIFGGGEIKTLLSAKLPLKKSSIWKGNAGSFW